MYNYTVYAYWNQDQLYNLFNSIVIIMGGGGDFLLLLKSVAIVGLIAAAAAALAKARAENFAVYFIFTAILYGVMIVPKTTVVIEDVTGHNAPMVVNNVPWGLGAMASITSHVGYWLTKGYETALSIPGDIAFQKNGFLFGAKLLTARQGASIRDPQLRTDMLSWYKDCLAFEIIDNPARLNEIRTSVDLWTTVGPYMNPGRVVSIYQASGQVELINCVSAYGELNVRLTADENNNVIPLLKNYLFANDPLADTAAAMTTADATMLNVAAASADTIKQAMMLNLFRDGPASIAAVTNNPTMAAIEMAKIQAAAQANSGYETARSLSESALPLIRNAIHTLIIGVFPIVLLMIIVAGDRGIGIFGSYVAMLIFVELWAPLFAIVNHLLTYASMRDTANVISSTGGVTLETYDMVSKGLITAQGVAGMLTISIPVMAYMIVSKSQNAAANLASGVMAPSQSASQSAGANAAMGNMQGGNVQWTTGSMRTFQSDQVNTAPSYKTGGATSTTVGSGADAGTETASYGNSALLRKQNVATGDSFSYTGNNLGSATVGGASGFASAAAQQQRAVASQQVTSASLATTEAANLVKGDVAALTKAFTGSQERSNTATVSSGHEGATTNSSGSGTTDNIEGGSSRGTSSKVAAGHSEDKSVIKSLAGDLGIKIGKSGRGAEGSGEGAGGSAGVSGKVQGVSKDTDSIQKNLEASQSDNAGTRKQAQFNLQNQRQVADKIAATTSDSGVKKAAESLSASIGKSIAASESYGSALTNQEQVSKSVADTSSASGGVQVASTTKAVKDLANALGDGQNIKGWEHAADVMRSDPQKAAELLYGQQGSSASTLGLAGQAPSKTMQDINNEGHVANSNAAAGNNDSVEQAGQHNEGAARASTPLNPASSPDVGGVSKELNAESARMGNQQSGSAESAMIASVAKEYAAHKIAEQNSRLGTDAAQYDLGSNTAQKYEQDLITAANNNPGTKAEVLAYARQNLSGQSPEPDLQPGQHAAADLDMRALDSNVTADKLATGEPLTKPDRTRVP